MSTHLFPIKTAFIIFPVLAVMLLIPFLIFNYRKYGYVNKWRSVILYSLLLYLLNAYFLVILPLPQTYDTCSLQPANTQHMQLIPFYFIGEIGAHTSAIFSQPATYVSLLKEPAFLQVAFNVILTIPFGMYLRYYFRRSFAQTVFFSFCLSIFFEFTQITGLYGIYNCPYRLLDVDDLFSNAFGGITGYIIAPIFTYSLPKASELDAHINLATKPVGFIRRIIAFQIDWALLSVCITALANLNIIPSLAPYVYKLGLTACFVFLYFIIIPYFTNGKTLGKALLRIHVKGKDDRIAFTELLVRYGLFYFILGGIYSIFSTALMLNENNGLVYGVLSLIFLTLNGLFALHVLVHLFSKEKLLLHERMSGTRNVIVVKETNTD